MASRTPNELWLKSAHQQTVLCCQEVSFIAENMPMPISPVDDPKVRAFMNAMGNESLNLTRNPTTIDLANAEYIIEVERTVIAGGLMPHAHSRYFLPPSDSSSGKYVEVHVKDAFGGINPIEIQDTPEAYFCRRCINLAHIAPEGRCDKYVGVMENPLRGQNLPPPRYVSGEWLITGKTSNWGT